MVNFIQLAIILLTMMTISYAERVGHGKNNYGELYTASY